MRKTPIVAALAVLGCFHAAVAARSGWAPLVGPARPVFAAEDVDDGGPPVIPGHEPDSTPRGPDHETTGPMETKPPTRAESLDALFGRLAKTKDPDEATGIASLIQRMWMESGSNTADLLMARAMAAMGNDNHVVARALLDKIVNLRPTWVEGWNKRATLRFLDEDDAGSMEDISHALALEPRHFGAISGLGFILKRNGQEKAALKALRRAEEIYPESPGIRKAVDELVPSVEGRDL